MPPSHSIAFIDILYLFMGWARLGSGWAQQGTSGPREKKREKPLKFKLDTRESKGILCTRGAKLY
jgi:hypothetical protein